MGVRIQVTGRATVHAWRLPGDPDEMLVVCPDELKALDGFQTEVDDLAGEIGSVALVVAQVQGGTLGFEYDEGWDQLRAISEYRCPRWLSEEELMALAYETLEAWTDGVGEEGFEAEVKGRSVQVYPYALGLSPQEGHDLCATQFES